jgi:hypothetical protein
LATKWFERLNRSETNGCHWGRVSGDTHCKSNQMYGGPGSKT